MFMQSVQFPIFQAIYIFLQIRLDGSNWHIFPPCFAQMKWKIDGSSAHKHERTLQFLHFSQQYTVHIMARREKNRAEFFSCVRVQVTASPFSPANMCIYIMVARRKTTGRLRWLVAARIDYWHILPMVNANVAQIGSDGATRLWCSLRS